MDAVYINGGGWDAFPVIDVLERDLGTKVVWALAAELWEVCERAGVAIHIERGGMLLREGYRLPAD
jgi:maleate cis-trans isomerase